jgi:hypothetical protein
MVCLDFLARHGQMGNLQDGALPRGCLSRLVILGIPGSDLLRNLDISRRLLHADIYHFSPSETVYSDFSRSTTSATVAWHLVRSAFP